MCKGKKSTWKERGQGTMEYVLISTLIGILCIGALRRYGQKVNRGINKMSDRLESVLGSNKYQ